MKTNTLALLSLFGFLTACPAPKDTGDTGDADADADADADLSIGGVWTDGWANHSVDNEGWVMDAIDGSSTSFFHISQYDNDFGVVIAQNDSANAWNADLWSRFDWTFDGTGALWYCQSAYDAADETVALDTPAATSDDPAAGGCDGFAWSALTAVTESGS